jgi:predicted RNA methylase
VIDAMTRPELTMPEAEAAMLRAAYGGASVILEYGTGGSTLAAADMPGKTIFAVESDRRWLSMMRDWIAAHPGASPVHLHRADIGETRRWGRPRTELRWRQFADYPLGVWDRDDFLHPDVVLIDGRFRVGCFLATILRIIRPVTVLFDDYLPRLGYRAVEEWFAPVAIIGRMAQFQVSPVTLNPAHLRRVIAMMQEPV